MCFFASVLQGLHSLFTENNAIWLIKFNNQIDHTYSDPRKLMPNKIDSVICHAGERFHNEVTSKSFKKGWKGLPLTRT